MNLQIQIRFLIKTLSCGYRCYESVLLQRSTHCESPKLSPESEQRWGSASARGQPWAVGPAAWDKNTENTNMSVQQLQQDDLRGFFNESQPLQDSDVYRLPRSLSVDQQINTININILKKTKQ